MSAPPVGLKLGCLVHLFASAIYGGEVIGKLDHGTILSNVIGVAPEKIL